MKKSLTHSGLFLVCLLVGHAAFDAAALRADSLSFQETLRFFGMTYDGKDDFIIEKSYQRGNWQAGDRPGAWTVIAGSGRRKIRLEASRNIDQKAAQKRMDDRFASVEGLYKGYAFYPGMITQRFEVPKDVSPEIIPAGPRGYKTYILYSTTNLTYGAGDPTLAVYRGVLTYRYCSATKTLVQIELFVPKEDFDKADVLKVLEDLH